MYTPPVETLLNLLWLAVILLLFARAHFAPATRQGRDSRRVLTAISIVCVATLIFPYISVSDDLNAPTSSEPINERLYQCAPDKIYQGDLYTQLFLVFIASLRFQNREVTDENCQFKALAGFSSPIPSRPPPTCSF